MDSRWTALGPPTRLWCPYCAVEIDEPPAEASIGLVDGGAATWRIRQRTPLPALAAHVLDDHPGSAGADAVRAAVAEHGSVEQAVRVELEQRVRAAVPALLR